MVDFPSGKSTIRSLYLPPHNMTTHIIDYSYHSLMDCLNTGVINEMFKADLEQGKWDGATRIEVSDNLLRWSMSDLLGRPEVAEHLTSLDVRCVFLEEDALSALLKNPAMCQLEHLHMAKISSKAGKVLQKILSSPHMASLTQLSMEYLHIEHDEFELLAQKEHKWTHLSFHKLSSEYACVPWFTRDAFPTLQNVDLSHSSLGTHDIEALITSPWTHQLKELCINNTSITPFELAQIVSSQNSNTPMALEMLSVRSNWWESNDWCDALQHLNKQLPALKSLHLGYNKLGTRGLQALLQHPIAKHLQELELGYTALDEDTMKTWAQHAQCEHLHSLSLSNNKAIGDQGAFHLAACEHTPALHALTMRSCGMTKKGQLALLNSPHFTLDPAQCDFDF